MGSEEAITAATPLLEAMGKAVFPVAEAPPAANLQQTAVWLGLWFAVEC
jgi:hypothetical protein